MATGIHTLSPPNNMNLISEPLLYNNLPKDGFNMLAETQDYTHYTLTSNTYSYVSESKQELSLMQPSHHKIINCERGYMKSVDYSNAIQEYESDESCISYTPRDTPDNKGGKNDKKGNSNEMYDGSCVLNLYQPNIPYKQSKYYCRGGNRHRTQNQDEIERKVHGLMRRFQSRAYKMKVEAKPECLLDGGPWDGLNKAMWEVYVNRVQKQETYTKKLNLWKTIFLCFRMSLSNYGLYLVGSTMSGFALEGSDIDICLLTKPFSSEPRTDSLHHLTFLQSVLVKNGLASEAELIMAKVPILKFRNEDSGFEIDLNCNNVVSIQNTRLLYCYSQLDWRVRPLVIMVKIWAQANHINDAKNMTISSYSWTLMVIHFLQCGVFPSILPCLHSLYPESFNSHENHSMDIQGAIKGLNEYKSENTRCLGDLFIGFFQYYSDFNFQHFAISVRAGSRLPVDICKQAKSPKNDPHQWKLLCIEEPFDLSNTARSVFDLDMFKRIKQLIIASYKELACHKTLTRVLPVMHVHPLR